MNLWTVAYQAPPSMGFSRQEYWSGLPFSSPGDLPDPGMEPGSPAFQADALTSEPKDLRPLLKFMCCVARENLQQQIFTLFSLVYHSGYADTQQKFFGDKW